jgi:hypothetical protein
MANLIQIAEELEYMPKDQLAQMTQDPNSTYPQFLVLSEIQRRTQLEKAYQAQATQAEPQTTVAEETVAEFMAPQGLQGMAQQPMPQDMPAPMPESPMQMMADGGRIGFMSGGNSPRSILLSTMGANPSGMTDQEMGGLITRMNQESEQLPARRSFGLMEGEIVPEVVEEEEEMMAGGGRTGFFALGSTSGYNVQNSPSLADSETIDVASIPEETRAEIVEASKGLTPAQKAMIGINAASLALMVTPIPGARVAAGVLKLGSLVPKGLQAGKAAYQARKSKILMDQGRKALNKKGIKTSGTATRNEGIENIGRKRIKEMRIPQRTIAGGIAGGTAYNLFESENEEDEFPDIQPIEVTAEKRDIPKLSQETETKKGGLFSNITPDQGLTMAQLGGVLMGARNMSELGTGIAGVAGQMQERKSAAGLAGAQQSYYESQAREADAKVAAMPFEQLKDEFTLINDLYETQVEQSSDPLEIQSTLIYLNSLKRRLAELRGIDISKGSNILAEQKIS